VIVHGTQSGWRASAVGAMDERPNLKNASKIFPRPFVRRACERVGRRPMMCAARALPAAPAARLAARRRVLPGGGEWGVVVAIVRGGVRVDAGAAAGAPRGVPGVLGSAGRWVRGRGVASCRGAAVADFAVTAGAGSCELRRRMAATVTA
jgi:hypothetical protein